MAERNLISKPYKLEITRDNWKNWIEFLLVILPVTEEQRVRALEEIGDFEW